MLFICTKIKNVAVVFLVLLVFKTRSKKKQKILPCEQSCCCHTLGTRKKLQNSPPYEQSCCYHALGTRKKIGAKINSNFLIEVNDTKKFLRPLRR